MITPGLDDRAASVVVVQQAPAIGWLSTNHASTGVPFAHTHSTETQVAALDEYLEPQFRVTSKYVATFPDISDFADNPEHGEVIGGYVSGVSDDVLNMTQPTIASRVLDELRRCSIALDDDELAARLRVRPRQSINQVCRRLARAGRLSRYRGSSGKIVNDLRRGGDCYTQPVLAPVSDDGGAAGDSREQRHAESVMLELLGEQLGVALRPRRIVLDDGVRVEVDGADDALSILVEAWAHQGPPKVAQKHKVLADALKLLHVAATLPVAPRLILCLCDTEAARHFTTARSWAAHALRAFAVDVVVVELPEPLRAEIIAAQQRQFR